MNHQSHFQTTILTLEKCRLLESQVSYLRPFWIARNEIAPFFTLGAASYMDARADGQYEGRLHQIAPSTNLHADDVRITLQAHAIYDGQSWILYW